MLRPLKGWSCLTSAATLALMVIFQGCCPPQDNLPKPTRVQSQEQAATVLVSPTMVAPWADVSAALKPGFTMNGDTAVGGVLPTSEDIQSQALNAFGFSFGLGLPGTSTQASTGTTLNTANGTSTAGGVTTTTASRNQATTSSTTNTESPGVVPATPTGTPAGAQLPSAPALAGTLGLDPALKYKAANYLNQEVQLLNQEIDNVAVRNCFVPYVVKLKIGVMTYQPNLPYSVHMRVSFFPSADGPDTFDERVGKAVHEFSTQSSALISIKEKIGDWKAQAAHAKPEEQEAIATAISGETYQLEAAERNYATAQEAFNSVETEKNLRDRLKNDGCPSEPAARVPVVVPFLVADDIAVALKSSATEAAQQVALALNFMVHGIGGNVGGNDVRQALTAISSQSLSSNLTVGRDNDNTLYVHIEPNNQASGQPQLVGQTYDVAVLLLIPRAEFDFGTSGPKPASMALVTYTQFRDATSGALLDSRPQSAIVQSIDRTLGGFMLPADLEAWEKLDQNIRLRDISGLVTAVETGNLADFRKELKSNREAGICHDAGGLCDTANYDALWTALSSVISDSSYKSAYFEAPVPATITVPHQTLLLGDDGAHPIQVAIAGVSGMSAATLAAHLQVATQTGGASPPPPAGHPPAADVISIPAQSLALDPVAHVLTLTFPSLGKSGLTMAANAAGAASKAKGKSGPSEAPGVSILAADPANQIFIGQVNCDLIWQICPKLVAPGQVATSPTVTEVVLPFKIVSIPKAAPASKVSLVAQGGSIVIDKGAATGTLPLSVIAPASGLPKGDTLLLSVTGAPVVSIASPSGAAVSLGAKGYSLSQTGTYTLRLDNLMPGGQVTVSIQPVKSDGKTADGEAATASYTVMPQVAGRP